MRPHVTGSPNPAATKDNSGGDSSGPQLPAIFSRYKSSVESELFRSVPGTQGDDLFFPLRYHLGWVDQSGKPAESSLSQGKALRPTLCLFACEALDADPALALPAAAALELIHNFSLIHDDIQDQDVERRHQPTLWRLWGIPRALVAGNGLQSVGDLALLNVAGPSVPAETALRVSQILTESYVEMIQGQCLDLEFESRTDIKADTYLQMIAFKTGAIIRSGLEIGALLASGDPAAFRAFSQFGSGVGRAFQIRDDYLGIWGDQATTGKAAGNDIRRRKKTFPVVFALEKTGGPARQELLRIYGHEELDDDDVDRVLNILEEVGAQKQSQTITQTSAEEALEALAPLTLPGWATAEADALVDFLANREF
ncbi:MAG: hypothetical protein BZY88_06615 [SAR202 cluster bacterium Io17-Chloro-G9]|nr:MAG: hypothetical protein BZY88_06615 [SAR202 cluster bacterium Io17-Chloro-G9]